MISTMGIMGRFSLSLFEKELLRSDELTIILIYYAGALENITNCQNFCFQLFVKLELVYLFTNLTAVP